ncbi:zinc metalloproteinase nas-4-like [Ornithodoros turicata]|uniref:zinc metalloproteinase nas-4-like n=1 Tax=Ornithodoros turicata TaxID=34597 RepID=UPI003139DF64
MLYKLRLLAVINVIIFCRPSDGYDSPVEIVLPISLPEGSDEVNNDQDSQPIDPVAAREVAGDPLNTVDFETAKQLTVEELSRRNDSAATELGGTFEGDMNGIVKGRNAIIDTRQLWTNGEVPYYISDSFGRYERSVIARAVMEYHEKTCIRWKPRTYERDFVFIVRGVGCYSNVGRTGGQQYLSLGNGCVYHGTVLHEMMHAVGFYHEQSRADRDRYVTVFWHNIQQGMSFNFARYSLEDIQHLGERYDYDSIMHYGPSAFARSRGLNTIVPNDPYAQIGQRTRFSPTDIRKIQKLYQCNEYEDGNKPVTTTEGTNACKDKDMQCKSWARYYGCFDVEDEERTKYMEEHCTKTCELCDDNGATRSPPDRAFRVKRHDTLTLYI